MNVGLKSNDWTLLDSSIALKNHKSQLSRTFTGDECKRPSKMAVAFKNHCHFKNVDSEWKYTKDARGIIEQNNVYLSMRVFD